MRIRDQSAALVAWRAFNRTTEAADGDFRQISSGLRVYSARDDVAALGIAQRFTGQIRGRLQANRNVSDGISLIQTADGALAEVANLVQRGRELAVQAANGTLGTQERQYIQTEIDGILAEIDRISDTTVFNDRRLLNATANASAIAATINGLRSGWLQQAESIIQFYYGLTGDGSPLKIVLESNGVTPTWLTGTPGAMGKWDNLELHINLADFGSVGGPDGGTGPMYNDRKVAQALTKALLARNSNYVGLQTSPNEWFASGVASYISGLDEQLAQDIATHGLAAVVNAINTPWQDDSLHQSAAYLAIHYLDYQYGPGAVAGVIAELGSGVPLNTAMSLGAGVPLLTFKANFVANGAAQFASYMNIADADVGSIHTPADASSVIPNGGTYSMNPLTGLNVVWPNGVNGSQPVRIALQVGANDSDTFGFDVPEVTTMTLGLMGVDVVNHSDQAISSFNGAINVVSGARTTLGSAGQRLERITSVNASSAEEEQRSSSRLVDLDLARAMTSLTRNQILVSSSGAMMAQANTVRHHVMALLNALQ